MTYEELQRANETIKLTDIKGKAYAEVNQRIKAFRMCYPEGFILTEMVSNESGVCVFRATVGYYGEDGSAFTISTGTAYEREDSTYINKTSYIENCETSAVGRALGMAGFGIDTAVASAEEVTNAINNQNREERKASPKQIEILRERLSESQIERLLTLCKVDTVEEIPMKKASEIIEKLKGAKNNE